MKAETMKRNRNTNLPKRPLVVLCVLMILSLGLWAGPVLAKDDAGVPGGFLRFGASARSLSLGNAVSGMADDVATAYWNPAGLSQLRTMEITAMGATMFNDTKYTFFAMGMPTESWGTFSLNGTFINSGQYERATLYEDLDETFSEQEGIVSLGWAGGGSRLAYGLNIKSVSQEIGGASGNSMGVDAGIYFRPHRLLSVGAAVQNLISPKITLIDEEEELVKSFRGGLALRFFNNRLMMSTDLVKTKYMNTSFRAGLEVWPARYLAVRGGYDSEREHMSAGAGFRLDNWQFDYAFVSTDLGSQNVLSATLRFGVPFGVKMSGDKALFSPSGSDSNVKFAVKTAVRGSVESWHIDIADQTGTVVKTLSGNGNPPDDVTWNGENEQGRLVGDGRYEAQVVVVDNLGQKWEYNTSVEVLGFKDRTKVPIRVEISGGAPETAGGN